MRKYPFIKQEEQKDCGVACISMILKYYKSFVGMEELRNKTHTNRNGTRAYDMVVALKDIGFNSFGVKTNLEEIKKIGVILPCIGHVVINSMEHYVVIYEIDFKKNRVVIGDPADSVKYVSFPQFSKMWNGVLIIMYPISKLPQDCSKYGFLEFIWFFLKDDKKNIVFMIVESILVALFAVCSTYYFQFMIDALNGSKGIKYMVFIFASFLIIGIIKEITDFIKSKLVNYINYKMNLKMMLLTYQQLVFLPYSYYSDRSIGDIVSRVNDLNYVRDAVSSFIVTISLGIIMSFISFCLLLSIDSYLAFISFVFVLIYCLIVILFRKSYEKGIVECQKLKANETSYLVEVVSGFNTVKGINLYDYVVKKYNNKYLDYAKRYFKLNGLYNVQNCLKNLIDVISFMSLIILGGIRINLGLMSIGSLITFNFLFSYFANPIKEMVDSSMTVTNVKSSIKRIIDLFYYENEKIIVKSLKNGNIVIKNLNFAYNHKTVLKNINLKINFNEKIMVVGDSGSGKSTLFKLLLKYYKVERNGIMIDNMDINDYETSVLSKNICYISQNEILFSDSLYNNIVLDKNISNERLQNVVNMCCIDKIVDNNLGYHMFIEEDGFNLSGGEKQRIVLARTLLRDSKIIIIDEGLSQVDTSLERIILKNILNLNKTIVFISHRLDNMDLFKRVVEMKDGEVYRDVRLCATC